MDFSLLLQNNICSCYLKYICITSLHRTLSFTIPEYISSEKQLSEVCVQSLLVEHSTICMIPGIYLNNLYMHNIKQSERKTYASVSIISNPHIKIISFLCRHKIFPKYQICHVAGKYLSCVIYEGLEMSITDRKEDWKHTAASTCSELSVD